MRDQVQAERRVSVRLNTAKQVQGHTSLNQILNNVHFQPEGGSNSVNNESSFEMGREQESRQSEVPDSQLSVKTLSNGAEIELMDESTIR
jgi:hypothetical protein